MSIFDTDIECPACGQEQAPEECFLGTLGNLDHFRCRGCGAQFHQKHQDPPQEGEPQEVEEGSCPYESISQAFGAISLVEVPTAYLREWSELLRDACRLQHKATREKFSLYDCAGDRLHAAMEFLARAIETNGRL